MPLFLSPTGHFRRLIFRSLRNLGYKDFLAIRAVLLKVGRYYNGIVARRVKQKTSNARLFPKNAKFTLALKHTTRSLLWMKVLISKLSVVDISTSYNPCVFAGIVKGTPYNTSFFVDKGMSRKHQITDAYKLALLLEEGRTIAKTQEMKQYIASLMYYAGIKKRGEGITSNSSVIIIPPALLLLEQVKTLM